MAGHFFQLLQSFAHRPNGKGDSWGGIVVAEWWLFANRHTDLLFGTGVDVVIRKRLEVRRRKWKRYTIKGGSLVYLYKEGIIGMGKPVLIEMGPIVDVSMGGIAFQYIENKRRQADITELAIAMPSDDCRVDGVPFETIADFEVAALPDGKRIRNRCVRFVDLTPYLAYRVEDYIEKYSMNILKDRRKNQDRRGKKDPRYNDREFATLNERRFQEDRRVFRLKQDSAK